MNVSRLAIVVQENVAVSIVIICLGIYQELKH